MTVLLIFGLLVVLSTAHKITFLDVPQYGDPRREATLVCHYVSDKLDPALHSVKWYRGTHEVFRFTPGQQPYTRTFNSTETVITNSTCNMTSCTIGVTLPKMYNTKLSFTCEVSTEGPRFAVVRETKLLSIAVTLKHDPVITGLPEAVQYGEEVLLNCTTQPAMPPANILWYIDGIPEKTELWMVNYTKVSSANEFDLRSSWRPLRLRVLSKNYVTLKCEATQPTYPPYTRSAHKILEIAKSPHLSMYRAAGLAMRDASVLMIALSVSLQLFIFSNYYIMSELLSIP